jgi:hypothetical protein
VKKKVDKKIPRLEGSFKDILVCAKKQDRSYIEIFTVNPENVAEENLGKLCGILEITDNSESSSYIVNYLISIIKKEYFAKTKRGPIESLEAALHKANLALSQLAEHGDIGWIGKLNAIISVIEKNNIHLAQTGSAKLLMLRGKILTDITGGGVSEDKSNPLKTFVDVLSGRLENNDRLIIATESIFEIFSFEEIKRSAIKFSPSEFTRFLQTALVNELDRAAVLVVEINEKEEIIPETIIRNSSRLNAFSREAFSKSSPKLAAEISSGAQTENSEEKGLLAAEIKEELERINSDFVDKKTGHIYIKEDQFLKEEPPKISEFLENVSSKFSHPLAKLPNALVAVRQEFQDAGRKKIAKHKEKKENKQEAKNEARKAATRKPKESFAERYASQIQTAKKWATLTSRKTFIASEAIFSKIKIGLRVILRFLAIQGARLVLFLKEKIARRRKALVFRSGENIAKRLNGATLSDVKYAAENKNNNPESLSSYAEKKPFPLPSFSKLKRIMSGFDSRQKLYAILAVIFLLVVPYFIVKMGTVKTKNPDPPQTAAPVAVPLADDKNVSRIENLNQIYSGNNILSAVNLNGKIFTVEAGEIADIANNKTYPYPNGFGQAKIYAAMNDLNFIFVIDENNKTISWSSASGQFQDNVLNIPTGSQITAAETYLTYIYLLDPKDNQIYRYPRANGGFGATVNWLKAGANISQAKYMADTVNMLKFFQGKLQDFQTELSATPISFDKIYSAVGSQNIFVLDKTNSRIVKFDLSGNIVSQYYNSEIGSSLGFTVSESDNLIYFTDGKNVKNFTMQ